MLKEQESLQILEKKQRFSKSMLWNIQRQYFENKGIEAWSKGDVPYYITSNAAMGKTYAEVMMGILKDIAFRKQTADTIYILELGAGHGRFTYYFMKHFTELYQHSSYDLPKFCYIMSDLSNKNLEFYRQHEKLKPFMEKELLDICLFDIQKSEELYLENSGLTIAKNSLKQPVIVIGNYIFDCIPQELFYIKNQELYECFLTIGLDEAYGLDVPAHLDKLYLKYDYEKLKKIPYQDSFLVDLIEYYCRTPYDTHILFPVSAIQCLERLRHLSEEGIILLTADKGDYDMPEQQAPAFVAHGGCFSLSVNYHALQMYARNLGGKSVFPEHNYHSINIGYFVISDKRQLPDYYQEMHRAYEYNVTGAGPDILHNMVSKVMQSDHFSFSAIQDILIINSYDPYLLTALLPKIYEILPQITEREREYMRKAVFKLWEMDYSLDHTETLAFELGCLLVSLGFPEDAVYYLQYFCNSNLKH